MNYDRIDEFIFSSSYNNVVDISQYEAQNFTPAEEKHFYKFVDPTNIKGMGYAVRIISQTGYAVVKKMWENKNIYLYNTTYILWNVIRQYDVNSDFWERSFVETLYDRYCDLVYYDKRKDDIFGSTFLYYNFDLVINAWNTKHIMREAWSKDINYLQDILNKFRNIPSEFTEQANKIIAYLIPAYDEKFASAICTNYLITAFHAQWHNIASIPYKLINNEDYIYSKIKNRFEFCAFLKFYLKYWDDETAIKYIKKCKNKNIRSYLTTKEIYDYLLDNVDFNDNIKTFIRGQYLMDALL